MSVAILIKFKEPSREDLYIPVATQGAYSSEWVPVAEKLGLEWLPLFLTGTSVGVEDLPVVVRELHDLRSVLERDSRGTETVQRIGFILDRLREVELGEVAEIFIG